MGVYRNLTRRPETLEYKWDEPLRISQGYSDGPGSYTIWWKIKSSLVVEVNEEKYVVALLNSGNTGCLLSARKYETPDEIEKLTKRFEKGDRKVPVSELTSSKIATSIFDIDANGEYRIARTLQTYLEQHLGGNPKNERTIVRLLSQNSCHMRRKHIFETENLSNGLFDRIILRGAFWRSTARQILKECLKGGKKVDLARSLMLCYERDEYESRFEVCSIKLIADAILKNLPQLVVEKNNCDSYSWD